MRSVIRQYAPALVSVGIFVCCAATTAGERAKAALEEQTAVSLRNQPLKDTAAYFSDKHHVKIVIAQAVPQDIPITGEIRGQKLGLAFEILLRPWNLTYRADGDQIVIEQDKSAK